jgi:uncharacterized protein YecE (DUF72 family)
MSPAVSDPSHTSQRGQARVGCSGWQYPDWRGIVYPDEIPKRRWFEHYASLFDTVELNATFYRLPQASTVERWRDAAPQGFVYSVKLGGFGSHRMKLRDAESWLPRHVETFDLLGSTLGPTLVQLPPRWRRDVGRLDDFLSAAPRRLRWAVELREPSWLHDDVFAVLADHGAALCIHDLLEDHPRLTTADWTYLRFHGPDARRRPYWGRYGGRRLAPWAAWANETLDRGDDVYAYFNNDHEGHAVADARWLAERLACRQGVGRLSTKR